MKRKQYIIETRNPRMEGAWEADATGVNEPQSLRECKADIRAFKAGLCGQDFVEFFADPQNYRITEVR